MTPILTLLVSVVAASDLGLSSSTLSVGALSVTPTSMQIAIGAAVSTYTASALAMRTQFNIVAAGLALSTSTGTGAVAVAANGDVTFANGLHVIASTANTGPYSITNATFLACSSTLTLTALGGNLFAFNLASVRNTNSGGQLLPLWFLLDGAYVYNESSTQPYVYTCATYTTNNNYNCSVIARIGTVAAGSHNVCVGYGRLSGTATINSVRNQFVVWEAR